jgi:hypothetical protein
MLHERLHREHYTIGRRPIHLVISLAAFDGTKRVMERERVAGSALLAVRRDDRDFAKWFGGSHETLEAVGKNPVVVRTEQTHQR